MHESSYREKVATVIDLHRADLACRDVFDAGIRRLGDEF